MTNSQYLDLTGTTSVVNKLKGKLNEKASNSDVQLVVNEVVQLGQEMEFKLNVDLDNITRDGLAKIQESTDNRYLQLTGGTLTGHLLLGGGTETGFKKVEAIRNINGTPNAAAFYVNSDGTAAFFHKTYSTTALGGAVNDAILQFNNEGLKFAKGATNRTTASTFYNVLTDEYPYLKAVAVSADGKTLTITDKDNNTTEFQGGGGEGGDPHFKYNPTEEFTDGVLMEASDGSSKLYMVNSGVRQEIATTSYVDSVLGDINRILENIIGG